MQATTKQEAVRIVLYALRNPLALMSVSDRERAERVAREHSLTAIDLLTFQLERNRNV